MRESHIFLINDDFILLIWHFLPKLWISFLLVYYVILVIRVNVMHSFVRCGILTYTLIKIVFKNPILVPVISMKRINVLWKLFLNSKKLRE